MLNMRISISSLQKSCFNMQIKSCSYANIVLQYANKLWLKCKKKLNEKGKN